MERRAKVPGLLAIASITNEGEKRMGYVNRAFDAALNFRRSAVLEKIPPESTWENFDGQPLKLELYETRLDAGVGGRSKKTGGVCIAMGDSC